MPWWLSLRGTGDREKRLRHGGKGDEFPGIMVKNGLGAERRPGQQQPFALLVPDSEGERPDQLAGAVLAPSLIGGQYERGIGDLGRFPGQPEIARQLAPIVDPAVADQHAPTVAADQGLPLGQVLRGHPLQFLPQAGAVAGPGAAPVAAVARKRGSHLEQRPVGRTAAVRANQPEDRTQLMPRITAANVPADAHDNRTKSPAATAGIASNFRKSATFSRRSRQFSDGEFFTKGKLKPFMPNGP